MLHLRRLLLIGALCLGALGTSATAAAEDPDKRALELFDKGKAAYRQGQFEEAIRFLREAYDLKAEPVLLYNLARAYEGKGLLGEAADTYDRYLATAGDIPDRGAITKKVETLRALIAERAAKPKDEPSEPPPRPDPKPTPAPAADTPSPSPAPWIVAAFGAAGLGVGGVLGGLALSRNDDAAGAPSQAETAELRADAEDLALGSTISLAVGGAILAAGVVWGIVDVTVLSAPAEQPSVSVRVGPGALQTTLRF